ncbi:hypothetical protein QUF63_17000 [Anaerolineales bacterium HSG25]|nr:hypothetical protein [Anaerolineales bacterium HSG25]
MDIEQAYQAGLLAAQAGARQDAFTLLNTVVQADETRIEAWLWLSQLADNMDDKFLCLENVLTLEPEHPVAQPLKKWLQNQANPSLAADTASHDVDDAIDDSTATTKKPSRNLIRPIKVTKPSEASSDDLLPVFPEPFEQTAPLEQAPTELNEPEIITPQSLPPILVDDESSSSTDFLDDEWLCPYCAKETAEEDNSCPHCRKSLLVITRTREERSPWLIRGIWLQLGLAFYVFTLGFIYMGISARMGGVQVDLFDLLPIYVGLSTEQPPEQVELMLESIPLTMFWSYWVFITFSILMSALLFFRINMANLIYLMYAGSIILCTLLATILFSTSHYVLIALMLIFVIGVIQLVIGMHIAPDFSTKTTRLKTEIDQDAKGHTSLFISGRDYSRKGMWGVTVLHLRRAVMRRPNEVSYLLLLTKGYIKLNHFNMAEDTLNHVAQLKPDSTELQSLREMLVASRLKSG